MIYDIAINNCLCFVDDSFINANVGIEGNKIKYVGKQNVKGDIEFNEKAVLIPALFNAHTHVAMSLFRGYAEDMPLMKWLKDKIWKVEKKLKPKDIYWGTMLGITEMIKSGIGSFSDLYIYMDEVAKAVGESGIRAVLCYGMADRGEEERAKKELEIGEEFVRKWNNEFNGRVKAIFGPHAPYTCSPEFLKKVRERAKEVKSIVHIHVSETQWEVEEIKKRYGDTPVNMLERIGFLDSDTVIAHAVWLSDEEIKVLKKRNVSVVHCPVSNLKLSSGIARVRDMIKSGINVALGTDGAASNNSYNLFQEMKFTSLLQKIKYMRADAIKSIDVLKMAVKNGYKAYGINGGEIKPEKLADIAIIDVKVANFYPLYSIENSLVYSAYGSEVTHLIIDGKVVMEEREILTFDEEKVFDKVEKIKEKFI